MTNWLPWLECNPEQRQKFNNLMLRFGINPQEQNGNRRLNLNVNYSLTSYKLREATNSLICYLHGNYYYGGYNTNNTPPEIQERKANGMFEYALLMFLGSFSPEIKDIIRTAFYLRDRGNLERHDPIDIDTKFQIAYLPKGITDFKPTDKTFNEELSARLQREIIKENSTDPTLTDNNEKTITVKVFTGQNTEKTLHIYFNKKGDQTVRRVIYKAVREAIIYLNLIDTIKNEADKDCFVKFFNLFFSKEEVDFEDLLNDIQTYIADKMTHEEANLIQDFSKSKQTKMNEERKRTLKYNLENARHRYEDNLRSFSELKNAYNQAKKALDTFEEVEYNAIEVFLTKIKEHPGTKLFAKINNSDLQFLIEEPMIHTESETWARILTNNDSDVNHRIRSFASEKYGMYHTTYDILRFAIQRLIKEIFVDQKIRIYTAALLGIRADREDFTIEKYILTDNTYMPHPHIGTNTITCWSEAIRQITKDILENDGEVAFLQLLYALQQMTASDTVISRRFIDQILNSDYANIPIYIKKNAEERVSFVTLIKEFIEDETNKINSIIASESTTTTYSTIEQSTITRD